MSLLRVACSLRPLRAAVSTLTQGPGPEPPGGGAATVWETPAASTPPRVPAQLTGPPHWGGGTFGKSRPLQPGATMPAPTPSPPAPLGGVGRACVSPNNDLFRN